MNYETTLMFEGGFLAGIVVLVWIILHRIYKRAGRRCDFCGEWGSKAYHTSKILLPPGEAFIPSIALRRYIKTGHWWIRNACMVTFHVCPHCSKNDGKPRVRVVTFSLRAVSMWHLCWVYWFRKKEFYMEDESGIHYGSVLSSFIFQLRKRGGLEASSEIPPPHKISLPDFPDFSGINFPPPR